MPGRHPSRKAPPSQPALCPEGAVTVDTFLTPPACILISLAGTLAAGCTMNAERILVPIDTRKCHPEVLSHVNALASRPGVTVILLHVLNLNIFAPDNRLYEELAQEAHWHLERLAQQFLPPGARILGHVRFGKPVEETLAEAKAEDVDLIILSTPGGRGWQRLFGPGFRGIRGRLLRVTPCPLLFVHAATRFNCQKNWGRQADGIRAALASLEVAPATNNPSALAAQYHLAQTDRSHRLAA